MYNLGFEPKSLVASALDAGLIRPFSKPKRVGNYRRRTAAETERRRVEANKRSLRNYYRRAAIHQAKGLTRGGLVRQREYKRQLDA
jgi:hypothetical protein